MYFSCIFLSPSLSWWPRQLGSLNCVPPSKAYSSEQLSQQSQIALWIWWEHSSWALQCNSVYSHKHRSVTLNCQVTYIVMGSQLSLLSTSQMSQFSRIVFAIVKMIEMVKDCKNVQQKIKTNFLNFSNILKFQNILNWQNFQIKVHIANMVKKNVKKIKILNKHSNTFKNSKRLKK